MSPDSNTAQSKRKTNSPHHYHRKCMEKSVKNIHVDIQWFKGLMLSFNQNEGITYQ